MRHINAEQPHLTGRCQQSPGHAVEQRGLARTIGPDQSAPFARRDLQRDAVDSAQATEDLGEIADLDRCVHGGAAFVLVPRARRRLKKPTIPSGAHRIVAMKTMPMTAARNSKKLLTQLRSPSTIPEPRKGPMIVPEPPTIAISDTSTEI